MEKEKQILTSVKVDPQLFEDFKIEGIRFKFSLNKLVNRSILLFLKDPEYRKRLINTNDNI
jgi:hypothetical protein